MKSHNNPPKVKAQCKSWALVFQFKKKEKIETLKNYQIKQLIATFFL